MGAVPIGLIRLLDSKVVDVFENDTNKVSEVRV